jgi:ABC-type polysaccharide/polyol phosphate export permease
MLWPSPVRRELSCESSRHASADYSAQGAICFKVADGTADSMTVQSASLPKTPSQLTLAWMDLCDAIRLSWFWLALGWNDILQRYRGSILGPFWLTITTGVFIAGLGPLYARLFSLDMEQYLPFMALGVTTWNFITGTINDSCNAFIASAHMMRQMRLPRLALLFQVVWRSMISFLHNLPIYAVLFLCFDVPIGVNTLAVIPGFLILSLNLIWMGLIVAIVCSRFRDIAPIVGSMLQIGFFITPVMWNHRLQSVDPLLVNINPFAAFIEVVRAPLMGESASPPLLYLALGCLPVGYMVAAILFVRCRREIVYWV